MPFSTPASVVSASVLLSAADICRGTAPCILIYKRTVQIRIISGHKCPPELLATDQSRTLTPLLCGRVSQQESSPPPSSHSPKQCAPLDRPLVANLHESDLEGPVLVRLLPMHGHVNTCRWFARTKRITEMWKVIRDAMGQGARLLIAPSGEEVARDMTLGEMVVVGNQLTLELRWSGVGGGVEEDQELLDAERDGDKSGMATALSRGANVNAKNEFGNTPLSRAALSGHLEVVQVLLAAGADLDTKDNEENTPLLQAALHGHVEVAQVLLAAGADVNAKGYMENTPLMCAAFNGQVEVAQVLLAAGADVNAKGYMTALDAAKERGHTAIVAAIEQHSELLTKSAAQGAAADADQ